VIDGEHYAPVVRDALAELPYDIVAAVMAGGTEKLQGGEDHSVPLVGSLERRSPVTPRRSCSTSPTSLCSGRGTVSARRAAHTHGVPYEGGFGSIRRDSSRSASLRSP
jgi:hypothetical protein